MQTAVTQKGQVTIPKRVRDALGLSPGSKVMFETDEAGGARIVPVEAKPTGFARFRGIAKRNDGLSTDEYMRLIRDHD